MVLAAVEMNMHVMYQSIDLQVEICGSHVHVQLLPALVHHVQNEISDHYVETKANIGPRPGPSVPTASHTSCHS